VKEELVAVTVSDELLNVKDLEPNLLVPSENLFKLLKGVEIYDEGLVSVLVQFAVGKLFGVAPVDALNETNAKYHCPEEAVLYVEHLFFHLLRTAVKQNS